MTAVPGEAVRRVAQGAVRGSALACVLALMACASAPQAPDWLLEAKSSLERYREAALSAHDRAAQAEFARARAALASAGDSVRVGRLELVRCAVQVASLDLSPCSGFEPLREDAPPAERAYADYLAGRPLPADQVALLPADQQRALANAGAPGLGTVQDPLARLVGAAVALRSDRATPETLAIAVDTAAAQGWRRPLLAWLGVQLRRAEMAGDDPTAQRVRRRIDLITRTP